MKLDIAIAGQIPLAAQSWELDEAANHILQLFDSDELIADNLEFFGPLALRIVEVVQRRLPQELQKTVMVWANERTWGNDDPAYWQIGVGESNKELKGMDILAMLAEYKRRHDWNEANKPMRLIAQAKPQFDAELNDEIKF